MSRILTLKQTIFIKAYFESLGNATFAAQVAYQCNLNTAGVIGYQNLRKLKIREEIDRILASAELNNEWVATKLRNNLLSRRSLSSIKTVLKLKGLI